MELTKSTVATVKQANRMEKIIIIGASGTGIAASIKAMELIVAAEKKNIEIISIDNLEPSCLKDFRTIIDCPTHQIPLDQELVNPKKIFDSAPIYNPPESRKDRRKKNRRKPKH